MGTNEMHLSLILFLRHLRNGRWHAIVRLQNTKALRSAIDNGSSNRRGRGNQGELTLLPKERKYLS
uniref:Uncharacterized protein n=1 Tax=Arundo donax TaxID=35708 RepID=A0A0A9B265_ARUDO